MWSFHAILVSLLVENGETRIENVISVIVSKNMKYTCLAKHPLLAHVNVKLVGFLDNVFALFTNIRFIEYSWWRHQMQTFSALLAICAGNSPVPGEFPAQRPVTRSFDVFFDLRLNKRLSKQPWGWWFETASWSLWRHRNVVRGQWLQPVSLLSL